MTDRGQGEGEVNMNAANVSARAVDNQACANRLREIQTMLAVIPEPAATVCAVAAFTGLLMVNRSVWEGFTNEPKTKRSKAAVPVIPQLAAILERHRIACGKPSKGPMFANGKGNSANLNSTLNREVLPALNRCAICRRTKADHVEATVSHEFERDDNLTICGTAGAHFGADWHPRCRVWELMT